MGRRRRPSLLAWSKPQPLTRRLCLLLLSASCLFLFITFFNSAAAVLRRANALGRRCGAEVGDHHHDGPRPRIAMVSLSDESEGSGGGRSFRGVMAAVGGNKRAYSARYGYGCVDARELIDPSRPASWSKILAVQSLLGDYDWVFWNDADTVITNPNISLESILYAAIGHKTFDASPDLVVTNDFNGVNAGVFFVRRSQWSKEFLERWWNQTSFIQFGSTRSGDNFALQYLLDRLLMSKESRSHVQTAPMQCLFNSYPWVPTLKDVYRLISLPRATWQGAYSDGDFLVHLAGLDNKKKWAHDILEQTRS